MLPENHKQKSRGTHTFNAFLSVSKPVRHAGWDTCSGTIYFATP